MTKGFWICLIRICAALVLLCTAPDKHSAAIKQIFFPALTLIALLVALILFA